VVGLTREIRAFTPLTVCEKIWRMVGWRISVVDFNLRPDGTTREKRSIIG
jgi:hypothetical protein